jgi:hypothetical protein
VKVAEAARSIDGTIVTAAAEAESAEVRGGYASDLLSDVMANSRDGDLWVTLQRHVNIVAVAELNGLAGIVLVNGRRPEEATAARAEEKRIPIICTELQAFEAAGILYASGVRGRRPV